VSKEDPLVGSLVAGRYRVERPLGRGGMGAVYVATQEPLGRQVALKVLRPTLLDDEVAAERFSNEARVVAQLHHPNIVGIHDFDTTEDGVLFIAMELLNGQSLGEILRNEGRLPPERAALIVRDIARGLASAHRRGVVHRDLKPDNVVVVAAAGVGEIAKVLDFGIAKLVSQEEGHANLTGTGFVPGTPAYISPEQIMAASGDDPRVDLYSLGITWFELLTGERPFTGDSAMKVFLAHLNDEPPRPNDRAPWLKLPQPVESLLLSLLAKDPNDRPASAEALLQRLRELAEEGHLPAALASGGDVTPTPSSGLPPDALIATATATRTPDAAGLELPPPGATPATGTSPTTVRPVDEVARARPSRAWVGILVGTTVAALIGAGLWYGNNHQRLEEFRTLPVRSDERRIERDIEAALESYRRAELDSTRRAADRVLTRSKEEPSAWFLKALVAMHEDDWFGSPQLARQASTLLRENDRHECGDVVLAFDLVDQSLATKRGDVLNDWKACDGCANIGFGHVAIARAARMHDYEVTNEALALLDMARTIAPDDAIIDLERSDALRSIGRVDEALAAAQAGLQRNPGNPSLQLAAGRAQLASGELREADRLARSAIKMNLGMRGQMLAARVQLLTGTDEGERRRQQIVEGQLATAQPADIAAIGRRHGEALVGAGRAREAAALIARAVGAAVDGGATSEAAAALLAGLRALEAVNAVSAFETLAPVATRVLESPGLRPAARDAIAFARALAVAILAFERGDRATADKTLAELDALDEARLAPGLRDEIFFYLRSRLQVADGELDAALASTRAIDHLCVREERQARLLASDPGMRSQALARLDSVIAKADFCLAESYQGAALLNALAMKARLAREAGQHEVANQAIAQLQQHFPRADPTLPQVQGLLPAKSAE
jgi:serine/threonine protein kinase